MAPRGISRQQLGLLVAKNLERNGRAAQSLARDFLGQDAPEAGVTSLRNKIEYQSRKVRATESEDAVISLLKSSKTETDKKISKQDGISPLPTADFASPSATLLKDACRFAYTKVLVDGLSSRKAEEAMTAEFGLDVSSRRSSRQKKTTTEVLS